MRLDQLDFRTMAVLEYSQFLKRSDGIWCRAISYGDGQFGFQYMYEYPAPDWEGGLWSHMTNITALELACLISHCTPTQHRYLLTDADVNFQTIRVPKDHFLPWTEAELAEMLPITDKT